MRRINPLFRGVGIEWAEDIEDSILEALDYVDFVELIPENFFYGLRSTFLEKLRASGKPVLIHGVELSIGTDEPLKEDHLTRILRVADRVNTIAFSDHLCMTEAGGVEVGQLTPLPWSRTGADVVCRKIEQVARRLSVPLLIENIANRFLVPDTELSETDFINRVLRGTGCLLLLDLHNLHANAFNFQFDPYAWLGALDLQAVDAIHLAGGHYDSDGTLVDGHSNAVPPRVWDLYRHVCDRVTPTCTVVERAENFPPYEELLGELGRAKSILFESREGRMRAPVAAREEATS